VKLAHESARVCFRCVPQHAECECIVLSTYAGVKGGLGAGRQCREYKTSVLGGSVSEKGSSGLACRNSNGAWVIE